MYAAQVGTIIGPGTIFLMLVGAFVAAFKISNWDSFLYNLAPIAVYIFVCLTFPSEYQLLLASILSTMYSLVMMAVIVGTALQLGEDGIGSPSAIFLLTLIGSFMIAATLHPQEFSNILSGIIYLLCIPAMYLLLIIYSITNLHIVSWGTREVPTKKTKAEKEAEAASAAASTAKKGNGDSKGVLAMLRNKRPDDDDEADEAGVKFSLGNVLSLKLFTQERRGDDQLVRIAASLESLDKRLDNMERLESIRKKHPLTYKLQQCITMIKY